MSLVSIWEKYRIEKKERIERSNASVAVLLEKKNPVISPEEKIQNEVDNYLLSIENRDVVFLEENAFGSLSFDNEMIELHIVTTKTSLEKKLDPLLYSTMAIYQQGRSIPFEIEQYLTGNENHLHSHICLYRFKDEALKLDRHEAMAQIDDLLADVKELSLRGTLFSNNVHEYIKFHCAFGSSVKSLITQAGGTVEGVKNLAFNFDLFYDVEIMATGLYHGWEKQTGLSSQLLMVPYIGIHEQKFEVEFPGPFGEMGSTGIRNCYTNVAGTPFSFCLPFNDYRTFTGSIDISRLNKDQLELAINEHLYKIFPKEMEDGTILPIVLTSMRF